MNEKEIKRIRWSVYFWNFSLLFLLLVGILLGLGWFVKKKVILLVNGHVWWLISDWKWFWLIIFLYCLFALFICCKYFFYSFLTKRESSLDIETELKLKKEYRWHCFIFWCIHLLPFIFFIILRKWKK